MFVHYPKMYSELWLDLAEMVFANYSHEHYNDCVLICPHQMSDHTTQYRSMYPGSKLIAYNTEPVHKNHWISIDWLISSFKEVDEVWDYDIQNIEIWKNYGIDAKFKPIQYTPVLKRIQNVEEPDIDVLFFGSPTIYRGKYVSDFCLSSIIPDEEMHIQHSIKFISGYQIFGKLKDELTSRSKIILNMAPYSGARQQQFRIAYDLINNKCVLSEKASYNYFDDMIVEYEDPNDLAAKIRYLLRDDNWKQYTNNSFEDYCKRKYK